MNNIPTYTYDDSHAASADTGGSKFLDETGAYTGTLTYARAVQSSKGGWGVEFGFETDAGQKPKYPMTLWTLGPDGKRYFGHDLLDCILICSGMKAGMAMKAGKVKYAKWDYDLRDEVEVEADGYPGMSGKRIGLLIQRELYTNKKGNDSARHNIVGAFDPATQQAASEKIANKPAVFTAKRTAELKDKDTRSAPMADGTFDNGFSSPMPPAGHPAAAGGAFDNLNDDIPF